MSTPNYWEVRNALSKVLFPRTQFLFDKSLMRLSDGADIKEKGRKKGYAQFNILNKRFERKALHFKEQIIKGFIEVSVRVSSCPLPINIDLYDNLRCPFGCIYCVPSRTKIRMADGKEKVVERVREGDKILTYDIKKKKAVTGTVTKGMNRIAKELLVIKTKTAEISVTPEHPIFTKRGWIEASNLTKEDEVLVW